MGKKKNKKHKGNARSGKKNKRTTTVVIPQKPEDKVQKINQKKAEAQSKHELKQIKRNNFVERIATNKRVAREIFPIILYILSTILLIGLCVSVVMCIVFYLIGKDNGEFYNRIITTMQVFTGFVSLIIGIWALLLTIKADRKASNATKDLNIYTSSAKNDIQAVKESDVNQSSL